MKKVLLISLIVVCFVVVSILVFFSLFPRRFSAEIKELSSDYNLSPTLIASVINIESGYDENAKSKAGAVGLMQLLPETAYDCASRLGIDVSYEQLFDKSINMKLGCFYLRYLLDLFDGNLVNALCSYNWGYGNVRNWIAIGNVDSEGTIINIPIEETRNYLKKYYVCKFVYEKLYRY